MIGNETIERVRRFTSDRDWEQFHTSENMAKSISIEAAELHINCKIPEEHDMHSWCGNRLMGEVTQLCGEKKGERPVMNRICKMVLVIMGVLFFLSAIDAEAVAINAENFPDDVFRAEVAEMDYNKDGYLDAEDIEYNATNIYIADKGVKSLAGIEYLTSLTHLTCDDNSIEELDLSNNPALEVLACRRNKLTKLTLGNKPKLHHFVCDNNLLTSLDVSNCPQLINFHCSNNHEEE